LCLISGHSFISIMATPKQDSVRKRPPNFRIEIPFHYHWFSWWCVFQKSKRSSIIIPLFTGLLYFDVKQFLTCWIFSRILLFKMSSPGISILKFAGRYGEICEAHTSICKGKLKLAKRTMERHVVSIRLSCTKEKSHSYLWSSSPYLPNDEYLVNHVLHKRLFHHLQHCQWN
jgi:hypothetical protein